MAQIRAEPSRGEKCSFSLLIEMSAVARFEQAHPTHTSAIIINHRKRFGVAGTASPFLRVEISIRDHS